MSEIQSLKIGEKKNSIIEIDLNDIEIVFTRDTDYSDFDEIHFKIRAFEQVIEWYNKNKFKRYYSGLVCGHSHCDKPIFTTEKYIRYKRNGKYNIDWFCSSDCDNYILKGTDYLPIDVDEMRGI